jgi:hypothetical protein
MFDSGLHLTDLFAMLGISLVLCAGLFALLTAWPLTGRRVIAVKLLTALCFALLWLPLGAAQIPVVAYVRGISSDLSITLIALAMLSLGQRALGWRISRKREQTVVLVSVAIAALFLYPLALGWGDWDAYGPGWGSWGMLIALLIFCCAGWFKGLRLAPGLVALALVAWSLGLMESGNLWDYLIDPWLSTYALFVVCMVFIKYSIALIRRLF